MAKNLTEISLLDIAPHSLTQDKNVYSAIAGVDPELRLLSQATFETLILPRLDELPESVVDLLAWQYHVDFYEQGLGIDQKRALVRNSIQWHCKKGTPWAVKQVLIDMGLEPKLQEWFEYGGVPKTAYLEIIYRDGESRPVYDDQTLLKAIDVAKPVSVGIKVMLHVYHTFRSTLNFNWGSCISTRFKAASPPIGQDRESERKLMFNFGAYKSANFAPNVVSQDRESERKLMLNFGSYENTKFTPNPVGQDKTFRTKPTGASGVFYRTHIKPRRID